jgi:hypothetical protein
MTLLELVFVFTLVIILTYDNYLLNVPTTVEFLPIVNFP